MFVGHYGPAVWDTQRGHGAPIVTLWQGFLAVQAVDYVTMILGIFGVEGPIWRDGAPFLDIAWSHSLVGSLLISLAAGALFKALKPSAGWRGFSVVAALAFSHWLLDLVVHRPDLPILPGGTDYLGLGLWDYAWPSYLLEVGLLGTAIAWWLSVTRGPRWTVLASWVLVAVLAVLQFAVITAPTLAMRAGTLSEADVPRGAGQSVLGLVVFSLVALAIWAIERKRQPRAVNTALP